MMTSASAQTKTSSPVGGGARRGVLERLIAAVLSALAVVVVAHLVNVAIFFVAGTFAAAGLAAANAFFLLSSVFAFLLLVLVGVVTGFARAAVSFVLALVAAVVAAVLGTLLGSVIGGAAVTGAVFGNVLNSLIGVNLLYVLAIAITAALLARRVYRWALDFDPRRAKARTLLVRLPASNLGEGVVTHQQREPVDEDLADGQWQSYIDAFRSEGWRIVDVPVADDLADSVFVEDALVVFGRLAVVTNPGSEHRKREIDDVEMVAREQGLQIAQIREPGTLDGGDVLKVGATVYVGRGGRTNAEGIRQLRALVAPLGYTVVAVPVHRALHLKSAVTALPDGTVLGCSAVVDDPRLFERYLEVPEETGAHVVVLDESTVLMATSAPRSIDLVRELGYRVLAVDISEFEKLEGCVTCLSVRIR